MAEILELLSQLGPLHWWTLAALLVGIEMVMPTQYLLWPALAAVVTGLIVLLAPEMGLVWQLLIFAATGAASALTAHFWPRNGNEAAPKTTLNQRTSGMIGRQAVVSEDFKGTRGTVILDDTRWIAEAVDGKPLPSRTLVEIVGAEGTVLKVRPVG